MNHPLFSKIQFQFIKRTKIFDCNFHYDGVKEVIVQLDRKSEIFLNNKSMKWWLVIFLVLLLAVILIVLFAPKGNYEVSGLPFVLSQLGYRQNKDVENDEERE